MAVIESIILLIVIIIFLLYKLGTKNFNYWKKKGVPYIKPTLFSGNSGPLLLGKVSDTDHNENLYNQLKGHRFGGSWMFLNPALIVRDPEILKLITIKDFDYFINRNMVVDEKVDPIFAKNLLSIRDQKWRDMRNLLSPTFTSAKMRNMFHLVDACGQQMTHYIDNQIKNQMEQNYPDKDVLSLEIKAFFSLFTNDVIATSAFGVEVNSLKNPNNEFYLNGKEITDFTGRKFFISIIRFLMPYVTKKLNIQLFREEVSQFFRDLVAGTMKIREEKNIIRHDMIHLMMQARKEILEAAENPDNGVKRKLLELSDDDITAQVVLFLLAGFETTSTFLSFTAYELAVNKDVQTRLQEEIDSVIAEEGNRLTYDGVVHKMKYLDMVVSESLRKWPPLSAMDRGVSNKYVIPPMEDEPGVTLEKGDVIIIPIQGLHHDPEHFPNPDKFDPERFSPENKHQIKPLTYLPFGSGSRNCIGMRFALMEGKLCLVHLLRKYTIEVVPNTQIPLKLKKSSFSKTAENGIWVGLKPRSNL